MSNSQSFFFFKSMLVNNIDCFLVTKYPTF